MEIKKIRITEIELPLEKQLTTAIHKINSVCCALVTIETDDGYVGEGYIFCFNHSELDMLAAAIKSVAVNYIHENPANVEALWRRALQRSMFFGQAGVIVMALAPLDVACWDVIGKRAGMPLCRIFGANGESVKAYASGGLWLSSSLDELQQEARGFVATGFRAMKLRLGSVDWHDDVERVAAVQSAIPEDCLLMVDFNQGRTLEEAKRVCSVLDDMGLEWIEEPVTTWSDRKGSALKQRLKTPLAGGESEYLRYGIRRQCVEDVYSVCMPDVQRMGGLSELRRAVKVAEAFDMHVSPHVFSEYAVHVVAASPNGSYVEYMPWFERLFKKRLQLDASGELCVPTTAGIGLEFNWEEIETLKFDEIVVQ